MKYFPWPQAYDRIAQRKDVMAGLTVGVLLIPQAMAYALLAGVPPIYGIYASLIPMLIYSLLSTTPHVSVGPTALASILSLSAVGALATPGSDEYLQLILILAGVTGLIQLAFGFLRLGVLVSFLSRPVISGFISAAAVLIIFSQVKTLFGLEVERTTYLHDTIKELFSNFGGWHALTTGIGLASILTLFALKKWLPKLPDTLLLIVVTSLLCWFLKLDQAGVAVVGDIPAGLPGFLLPEISGSKVISILPAALIIALISFVETLSIGKTFSEKHTYYRINPNRELIALGAAKFIGAFFQGIPTSASFSRSAVCEEMGTRTVISSLVSVLLVAIAVIFITGWFYFIPLPVLAAIIVVSVKSLFSWQEMLRLWSLDKREWLSLMVTFLVTLFGGLQFGIAAGVLMSLVFFILKSARPHLAELGRLSGSNAFRNVNRFPTEIEDDVLIIRFDASLYFGNADFFRDELNLLIAKKGDPLKLVIIDAHTIHDLDTTGAYILQRIISQLRSRGVKLFLTGAIGPVRDRLFHLGLMDNLGTDHQFLSIQDALNCFRGNPATSGDWDKPAVQHD